DFVLEAAEFSKVWSYRESEGNVSINTGDVLLEGTSYRLEGSEFYWVPWSLALAGILHRPGLRVSKQMQNKLSEICNAVAVTAHKALGEPSQYFGTCEIGEALFGVSWLRERARSAGGWDRACIETIYANYPLRAE